MADLPIKLQSALETLVSGYAKENSKRMRALSAKRIACAREKESVC